METTKSILSVYKQNDKLPIRLISPNFRKKTRKKIESFIRTGILSGTRYPEMFMKTLGR